MPLRFVVVAHGLEEVGGLWLVPLSATSQPRRTWEFEWKMSS